MITYSENQIRPILENICVQEGNFFKNFSFQHEVAKKGTNPGFSKGYSASVM